MPQLEVAIVGRLNNKAVVNEDGALLVSSTGGGGGGGGTQYANGASAVTPVGNQVIYNESGVAKAVTPSQPLPTTIAAKTVTPTMLRTSATTPAIPTGVYSISIANVGSATGTVLGANLNAGEVISIDAGAVNNTLGAITYNATGTEFLIVYTA
jgi:hypothetical protein